jgi:hypothetical protein
VMVLGCAIHTLLIFLSVHGGHEGQQSPPGGGGSMEKRRREGTRSARPGRAERVLRTLLLVLDVLCRLLDDLT